MNYYIIGAVVLLVVVFLAIRKKPTKEEKVYPPHEPKNKPKEEPLPEPMKEGFPVVVCKDGVRTRGILKMQKQGLQVFNEKGECVLDVTDRLSKSIGQFTVQPDSGKLKEKNGENLYYWTFTDDRLKDGTFWCAPVFIETDGAFGEHGAVAYGQQGYRFFYEYSLIEKDGVTIGVEFKTSYLYHPLTFVWGIY